MTDAPDITEKIERFDAYEQRAGVTLKGLFAYHTSIEWIGINGEIHSLSGDSLKSDIRLIADLLDENGRVIGNGEIAFYASSFFGFETFTTEINPNGVEVFKIRLYPKLTQ